MSVFFRFEKVFNSYNFTASIHVQTEMMLYPPHPAWQRKGRGGPRTEWRELLPQSELQFLA